VGHDRVVAPHVSVGHDRVVAPDEPVGAGDEIAAAEPAGIDARVRGSLVHRLLEGLDFARPAVPDAEAVRAPAADWGVEIADDEVEDVRALVAAFADSPLRDRLAAARRTRREAPFAFALDPDGGGPLVNGFLDVVALERDGGVLIVDYKSDRLEATTAADLVDRDYATQRLVYALAALRDGAPRAEVAYCFLEQPGDPVTATFTQEDAPALAERLHALAAGVLEARYEPTDTPHRDLCADCPGRAALCSYPEERTLAPL
jgi:ATP-dependent helicase/nuclease subunit A